MAALECWALDLDLNVNGLIFRRMAHPWRVIADVNRHKEWGREWAPCKRGVFIFAYWRILNETQRNGC